jgi:hypothetical protein
MYPFHFLFVSFSFIFLHLLSALDKKTSFSSFSFYFLLPPLLLLPLLLLPLLLLSLSLPCTEILYLQQHFLRHIKNHSSLRVRKAEDFTYVKRAGKIISPVSDEKPVFLPEGTQM